MKRNNYNLISIGLLSSDFKFKWLNGNAISTDIKPLIYLTILDLNLIFLHENVINILDKISVEIGNIVIFYVMPFVAILSISNVDAISIIN